MHIKDAYRRVSMRTTIDLSESLIQKAQKACGAKTKTMTIVLGLQELIHKAEIEKLRKLKGKIPLSIDLKASRDRAA